MSAATISPDRGLIPTILTAPVRGAQRIVGVADALKKDTDGFYSVIQTVYYFVMGLEGIFGAAKPFTLTLLQMAGGIAVIDFFGDLVGIAYYWISGDFIEDGSGGKICNILAMFFLSGATIGGAVLWLAELGFYSLDKAAAFIGSVPFFGTIATIGLAPIVCGAAAIGYVFLVGDALQSMAKANNSQQIIKSGIDLISRTAHVFLYTVIGATIIFPIAPVISVPVIVLLGITAKGMGVVGFVFQHFNKVALAEK